MNEELALKWKEQIKARAMALGFVAIGFTGVERHEGLAQTLEENERRGIATPFVSYTLAERSEPQAIWPACKTVVALAYPLLLSAPPQVGEGVISRSAVGEDYHRILKGQLEQLVRQIQDSGWPGKEGHIQVDTGPLNERAFAARAGVGWIGRNQQLIVPKHGSFVAMGLLLLDETLPSDEPLNEQCGECERCLRACPAKVLGETPFEGSRCLSYITQSKEELSPEEAVRLGNRIFGCDTCQEVCPHNRERLEEERLGSAALTRGVDLMEVLNLSGRGFKEQFRHTAAGWRGKGILKRNALIALKNARDERLSLWLESSPDETGHPL